LPKGLPKENQETENQENSWKIISGRIEVSPKTKDKTIEDRFPNRTQC
tara:strand:+ start:140 stop:283 length:144 start_codon:yes stop_codon:yes gene_type:complete